MGQVYDLMVKRDRKTHRLELFNRDKNTWKVAGLHWLNASKVQTIKMLVCENGSIPLTTSTTTLVVNLVGSLPR